MTLIDDYILKEFGFKVTTVKEGLVSSVGTNATKLFDDNPNRLAWFCINLSANTIRQAFDAKVSSSRGIVLDANGGSSSCNIKDDLHLTHREVWVVATGVNSAIYAFEIVVVA
jgi:hypothetical protein